VSGQGDDLILTIRKATEKDHPRLVEIMDESADREELKGFTPPKHVTRKFLAKLKRQLRFAEHGVFIAETHQKPVGFVFLIQKHDCFEIEELDVVKEHQKQGIGKSLVNFAERFAREKGATSILTGTAVNSEGKLWKAHGFWVHMGYRDTGKRTDSEHGLEYSKLVKRFKQAQY
jgi:GNAT superfamily N-acetyltransferase